MGVEFKSTFYEKLNPDPINNAQKKATYEVMYHLFRGCVQSSPYKTGKLQESHSIEITGGDYSYEGLLKNGAKYWGYVEFGTSKMAARHWVADTVKKTNCVSIFTRSFKAHYKPPK